MSKLSIVNTLLSYMNLLEKGDFNKLERRNIAYEIFKYMANALDRDEKLRNSQFLLACIIEKLDTFQNSNDLVERELAREPACQILREKASIFLSRAVLHQKSEKPGEMIIDLNMNIS